MHQSADHDTWRSTDGNGRYAGRAHDDVRAVRPGDEGRYDWQDGPVAGTSGCSQAGKHSESRNDVRLGPAPSVIVRSSRELGGTATDRTPVPQTDPLAASRAPRNFRHRHFLDSGDVATCDFGTRMQMETPTR